MVLKKSKFGSNTGNTLRRLNGSSTKGSMKYLKSAGFIRKTYNSFTRCNEDVHLQNQIKDRKHENALNTSANVCYSLNKDGRWELPGKLKRDIQLNCSQEGQSDECKNQIQCKKSSKRCIKGKLKTDVNQEVMYIETNHQPLSSKTTHVSYLSSGKTCKKTTPSWKDLQKVDITYTVEKPFQGVHYYHSEAITKHNKQRKRSRWKRKFDINDYFDIYDDSFDFDDDFDEEYELFEQQLLMGNCQIDPEPIDSKTSLDAEKQIQMNNIDSEYDFCDDFYPQTPAVEDNYLMADLTDDSNKAQEMTDRWVFPMDVSTNGITSTTGDSFQCVVQNNDIREEMLIRNFGQRYVEAKCSPRRIVIFDENFLESGSYIVIQILKKEMDYSKVKVNCKQRKASVFENIDIYKSGAVDIIPFIHSFFKQLSTLDNSKVVHIRKSTKTEKEQRPTYLLKYFKQLACIVSESDVWFQAVSNQKSDYCLEELLDFNKCTVCASSNELLYTTQCYHSLCRNCWTKYIENESMGSLPSIICPEDGCRLNLDPVLVISHLNVNEAMFFVKRFTESYITQCKKFKRCSFGNCLKIACYDQTITKSEEIPLIRKHHPTKEKYTHLCFQCDSNEHWPASCESVQQYERDKAYTETYFLPTGAPIKECIFYKKCPSCDYPIEKEGGCDYMTCFCGVNFCWKCLTLIKTIADESHFCCNKPVKRLALFSLDSYRDDVKVRLIHKAIAIDQLIEQISKKKNVLPTICDNGENEIIQRGYNLYVECYSFLRNLYIETAFTESRHIRSRVVKYAERLVNALNKLEGSTFLKSNTSAKNIHIGCIIKDMATVESVLDEMGIIGIKKK